MTSHVTDAAPNWLPRIEVADANYTIPAFTGALVAYTSLTTARTITLPSATTKNQLIRIVDESGNCNTTNTITILPYGTDVIETQTSRVMDYPYASFQIESNGNGKWVIITNPNPSLSAGMKVQPSFTDNGNGSITLGSGRYALYSDSTGQGKIKTYTIAGGTYTLTDGSTNYVIANYNSGTPTIQVITDVTQINETTIIPIFTIYRSGTTLYDFEWDQLGDALTNKIHKSIVKTQRYRLESGLGLGEAATRLVTIGSGTVWTGAVPTSLATFNSSVNSLTFAYHVAGVWTFSTVTQYNNTQYDDGTNLQTTPGGKYCVNFIYRSVGNDNAAFYVLGNQAYSLGAAQAAQPPALPSVISSHCILVGRIIVSQGASTATQIDSAFTTVFTPTPSLDHNSLANLQGGTTSQYYHLTSAEYTGTGTGNFVRLNAPTVTGVWTFQGSAIIQNPSEVHAPTGFGGFSLVQDANNPTANQSYLTINFTVPTTGLIGQFLSTASNYSSSANLMANSMAVLAYSSGANLLLGSTGSGGYVSINAGGVTSTSEIVRVSATGLSTIKPVGLKVYTVATLPSGVDGMIAFVSDATATTFASTVAGGGTNHVPVYYDGGASAWKIG